MKSTNINTSIDKQIQIAIVCSQVVSISNLSFILFFWKSDQGLKVCEK